MSKRFLLCIIVSTAEQMCVTLAKEEDANDKKTHN